MCDEETIKRDILSFDRSELEREMLSWGESKFRAKQIFHWLHVKKVSSFEEMTDISAQLRDKLYKNFCIYSLKIKKRLVSEVDYTVKYLYEMFDGETVESVLMKYKHGNSLCVSAQAGCRMGCAFCASTIAGFRRNLFPSEFFLQVYESERDSGERVDNIVLMGIGEPLDNYDNTVKFLRILEESGTVGMRHVSLSTCGIVPKIYELSEMKLGSTLSVSLHAVTDGRRSSIMPVNQKYGIDELMAACRYYFDKTGRRISFEFALIDGVNDDMKTAAALAELIRGLNCHVNLIPVNEVKERNYRKSRHVLEFRDALMKNGINATIRRTLGTDIHAACGQLRQSAIL